MFVEVKVNHFFIFTECNIGHVLFFVVVPGRTTLFNLRYLFFENYIFKILNSVKRHISKDIDS